MPELFDRSRLNGPEPLTSGCAYTLPEPIAPDWHPQYGARLAVFPRNLARGADAGYWPDLATLVEDDQARQMLYCPCAPSAYSLRLVFHKQAVLWEIFKYKDADLVGYARGQSYEQAMSSAAMLGAQADEAR